MQLRFFLFSSRGNDFFNLIKGGDTMHTSTAKLKLLRFMRQFIEDFDLNDLDELLGMFKAAIKQPKPSKTTATKTTLH